MAIKNWKIIHEIPTGANGGKLTYGNKYSNTEVTIRYRGGMDNYVSILGRGRYQPEYLVGGNSRLHSASKTRAFAIARKWMHEHPSG